MSQHNQENKDKLVKNKSNGKKLLTKPGKRYCQKVNEKPMHRMSIDKRLQGDNGGVEGSMGNEENSSFPPDSHKRICESGLEWLTAYRDCPGLDGLLVLQAVIVLNVRWRIVRRSRPPKMDNPEDAVNRPGENIK